MQPTQLSAEFLNPPHEFSVMPFWFWNDELKDEDKRVPYKLVKAPNGDAHIEVEVSCEGDLMRSTVSDAGTTATVDFARRG